MKANVGIIGLGTVGSALLKQVEALPGYTVKTLAVRRKTKQTALFSYPVTDNAFELIEDPEIDIIFEAINNSEDALAYAKRALTLGKTFISASKAMLANELADLHRIEQECGGTLLYEAAVGGAIPVLRTIREHLGGEDIFKVRGIVNGSCNYILTSMLNEDLSFDEALQNAQILGYAESDPSSDVDGVDSYYKALILAHTINKSAPSLSRIKVEGIRNLESHELKKAYREGQKVKLIAEIEKNGEQYKVDVRPRLIDQTDGLYYVDGVNNAIEIDTAHAGRLILQGQGAGGHPTASAMIGDLVNAQTKREQRIRELLLQI